MQISHKSVRVTKNISLLPYNFIDANTPDDYLFSMLSKEIAQELQLHNLIVDDACNIQDPIYKEHRDDGFLLPVLYIGQTIAQNPELFQLTLNIISSYLCKKIKGLDCKDHVKMKFFKSKSNNEVECWEYEGPSEPFKEFTRWKKSEHGS